MEWKYSRVVPIPKIDDPLQPNEFRPISILPSLSKNLELIMRDLIVEYLQNHYLLDTYQSGFRAGHSMATALLTITDDIYKDIDHGLFVILVLLDFSKAFDTVDHSLLFKYCTHSSISPPLL
jgi:Reverse transcriptase (RNA-dependent DNA polymerase)